MTVPISLFLSVASNAQEDERFVQADVYNALYDAYIQCDADFGQSRSEFITEKLGNDGGRITIASLRKILGYNVEMANLAIAQKSAERASYVSEIIEADSRSRSRPVDSDDGDKVPYKEVRKIDAFLREQRQYVKVHACVLAAL